MGEIIGLILILISSIISLVAMLTLLPSLIPNKVAQARAVLQQSPRRAFAIGLVNAIFFLVIILILAQWGELAGLIALIILLALFALAAIGLAGVMLIVQNHIYGAGKVMGMSHALRSATLITLAGLFPLLGWFVLTPLLLLTSLGSVIMVIMRRKKREVMIES